MAKYASCSRAHGPQKAAPRISTTARRWQGLSALLRTSHKTGIFAFATWQGVDNLHGERVDTCSYKNATSG
jgi:hypothetical protein